MIVHASIDFFSIGEILMSHASNVYVCSGPEDEHAYDVIPVMPRSGKLDVPCDTCHGHGQWNQEIDLISGRSKRVICGHCEGRGWLETGDDMIAYADIILGPHGSPMWVTKYRYNICLYKPGT